MNRCRLLLKTDGGKYLDELVLDVAEDDYDALPEWGFVAIMDRSFNNRPEREKLEPMTLEERRTYLAGVKEIQRELFRDIDLGMGRQATVADDG